MMFINADTLEYPFYEGDVVLNPKTNWVKVEPVEPPINNDPIFLVEEIKPLKINGQFLQQWHIRKKTESELNNEKKPRKVDLELLVDDETSTQ